MLGWKATFTDLRLAGVNLKDWLEFHQQRRAALTPEELEKENKE